MSKRPVSVCCKLNYELKVCILRGTYNMYHKGDIFSKVFFMGSIINLIYTY